MRTATGSEGYCASHSKPPGIGAGSAKESVVVYVGDAALAYSYRTRSAGTLERGQLIDMQVDVVAFREGMDNLLPNTRPLDVGN